jgi:hypothetical protein
MLQAGIGRRAFLAGVGGGAGLLLARGLGVRAPGPAAAGPPDVDRALHELAATFSAGQRERIVLPWDHPSRQVTNTIAFLDRPHLGALLSPQQQALARRLCDAMLSERGRDDLAGTFAVEGRFEGCVLAIYGEPEGGAAQATIMGGHVHVRGGGAAGPLGGAMAYGHQVGNHRWRVEGNSFAYHGDAANRFFAALTPAELARAVQSKRPHELVLQPFAEGADLPGVRVGDVSEEARGQAQRLLDTVLGIHPEAQQRAARDAIDARGGLDALHVATFADKGFYPDMTPWSALSPAERASRGLPYWQVWRIEGPGSVFHFQGHPHVHAYMNVVRDPRRAAVGEALAETPVVVEGEAMRRLLEAALRRATGEPLAWYHREVPGRFCPGTVTTGLAWAAAPYGNTIAVAEIDGRAMAAPLRERLEAGGTRIEPGRRYRVATHRYYASLRDSFGDVASLEETGVPVREALVAHLRAGGLESSGMESAAPEAAAG